MSTAGSVTVLLEALKCAPNDHAAQEIYERYITSLERVGRAKIKGLHLHDRDEQDVASVVMAHFFQGVREGRFPRLNDRHDLWQILLMLVSRRCIDLMRKEEPLVGESRLLPAEDDTSHGGAANGIARIPDQEPTPGTIAEMEEELRRRLDQLPEGLRSIAIWRMEGHSNAEIAKLLKRSIKRVEAKLNLIRKIWSETEP